ncbi:hypothetical protein G6011_06348 [Alternaria panax]|uniref:Uncharacterized protein n=1 Tax=Alternaria panax TaxID=48097 RepID=A0AAD4I5D8_9PLEO|nr:hypothetical protein G6011_06348 [Alternaria panax]
MCLLILAEKIGQEAAIFTPLSNLSNSAGNVDGSLILETAAANGGMDRQKCGSIDSHTAVKSLLNAEGYGYQLLSPKPLAFGFRAREHGGRGGGYESEEDGGELHHGDDGNEVIWVK